MERVANFAVSAGGLILGGYFGLKTFFYTVDAGQRGMIFDRFTGVKADIKGEGMHFYIPFIQVSIRYKN